MGGRERGGGEGEGGGKGREGVRWRELGRREVEQGEEGRKKVTLPLLHKTLPSYMNACDRSDPCQRLHFNRYVLTKSLKISTNEFTTHKHIYAPTILREAADHILRCVVPGGPQKQE